MKSTWFGDRKRYDFARLIAEADVNQGTRQTFPGFLTVASNSLRQAAVMWATGKKDDGLEEKVLAEQRRVKHPERYAEAFAVLVSALEDQADDFLGMTFTELALNDSKWKGQCFTPMSLCTMIAKMTVGDAVPDDERSIWLNEPACGGGAMMIAASVELKARGFWPWHYHWVATDVDRECFEIAYIQTTLLGIPATVIHGNTLSLEQWDQATTLVGLMHPPRPRTRAKIGMLTDAPPEVTTDSAPAAWSDGKLF